MTEDLALDVPRPHDIEAEKAVLGLAMRAGEHLTAARAHLNGGQEFYRPLHGDLWLLLCTEQDASRPVDPISVKAAIDKLPARNPLRRILTSEPLWLPEMYGLDVGPAPTPDNFARIVKDLYERRQIIETGERLIGLGRATEVDLDEIRYQAYDRLEQEVARIGPRPPPGGSRHLDLTPASQIAVRPVHWVWQGRLALGTLGLLAGPEGVGKSTLGYWLAGRITRGDLPGIYQGSPSCVLVAATEDSWEHTIVPRLMAAHADLDRVFRVEVVTEDEHRVGLSMPRDLVEVRRAADRLGVGLMLLDPLMSRLDSKLDSHKDMEVRQALEPLTAVADDCRMAILGLIHFNKGGSTDPLERVMGSKAFSAVARSVSTVIRDPDDETGERRLFGTPKNNLGRSDLPTLAYTIKGVHIADTDEGAVWTGKLDWTGEVEGTIADAMGRAARTPEEKSDQDEAAEWLQQYLESNGGEAESAHAKRDGAKAGHREHTLKRAMRKIGCLVAQTNTFPTRSLWKLPNGTEQDRTSGQNRSEQQSARHSYTVPSVPTVPTTSGNSQTQLELDRTVQKSPRENVPPEGGSRAPTLCSVCYTPLDPDRDSDIHERCDPWKDL